MSDRDENPMLHELRELRGILQDHQLDHEPPISDEERGILEGLEMAIDELNEVIDDVE